MKKIKKINSYFIVKFIAWIEVFGGISGLIVLTDLLIKTEEINGVLLFIFLTGFFLFGFSIFSGKRLLENAISGYIYSYMNLGLQILQVSLLNYKFSYSSCFSFLIGVSESRVVFSISIIPSFNMAINSASQGFIIINLFPVFFLLLLYRAYRAIKQSHNAIS